MGSLDKSRREVLAHTRVMSDIFCVGEEHGEKEQRRLRNALHEEISTIPNLILNQKDHKPVSEEGLPKTRPVCAANSTHNQRLSDLLSDIMNAVFKAEDTAEAISTGDILSKIDKVNKKIKDC